MCSIFAHYWYYLYSGKLQIFGIYIIYALKHIVFGILVKKYFVTLQLYGELCPHLNNFMIIDKANITY